VAAAAEASWKRGSNSSDVKEASSSFHMCQILFLRRRCELGLHKDNLISVKIRKSEALSRLTPFHPLSHSNLVSHDFIYLLPVILKDFSASIGSKL